MNKYIYSFIIIILIVFFEFCTNKKNNDCDFTEESFNKTILLTDGEKYNNKKLFLGHPTSLKFHPDSFLIVEDSGTPYLLKIIDLKNNEVQEVIPRGKGPGEMIVSWGVDIKDNNLYAFCGQQRKIMILSKNMNRKFEIVREFKIEDRQTMKFYPLKANKFICLSGDLTDVHRITYLDENGKIIKKVGDLPPYTNSNEVSGNNDIFFSFISATPDGDKIVLACRNTDIIEIYDTEKGLIKRIQGPLGIHLAIYSQSIGSGYTLRADPHYSTYKWVIANEKEFWVSFKGFKYEKGVQPSPLDQYPKKIYCFTWKGNPIRKIEFNHNIISYDVDWQNLVLYTIRWTSEDPEINSFPLKKHLK